MWDFYSVPLSIIALVNQPVNNQSHLNFILAPKVSLEMSHFFDLKSRSVSKNHYFSNFKCFRKCVWFFISRFKLKISPPYLSLTNSVSNRYNLKIIALCCSSFSEHISTLVISALFLLKQYPSNKRLNLKSEYYQSNLLCQSLHIFQWSY